MSALDRILRSYRKAAKTEREKGTYFERLTMAYLINDPVQSQQYSEVRAFADWAKDNGLPGNDIGIDLVAKLADEDGYAAIQCKFHAPDHSIQRRDVDSFLSASGKEPFKRRVFIDSTEVDWSVNVEKTVRGQSIPVVRIGLNKLRESRIDWAKFEASNEVILHDKKQLLPHQRDALNAVLSGLTEYDRGKLIMACGTGKTFTALKIAEEMAGKGKRVLFMAPSLALISQSVREWTAETETDLRSFAVCSDAQVGKGRKSSDDVAEIEAHELDFPATTDAKKLAERCKVNDPERMTVVFSTYQSIHVITKAQELGLQSFDLIICDEAHRTTGATIKGEEASNFVRVHDNAHVQGAKRLYMTATPRIFGDNARSKAAEVEVKLCDMDDEVLYGPTLFTRGFSWAVENDLLSDYKVVVLAMDDTVVSRTMQRRLAENKELQMDDATKIIGCYKALQKQGGGFSADSRPMRSAIAFCRDIKSSKLVAQEFAAVVDEYSASMEDDTAILNCEVKHVDGTFNAKTRGELLHWLDDGISDHGCRILSNARCLSEGVDVPSLDAIMFMHPRKSQIDVVQSVGRVMRKAPGKKMGYVILPVVIPASVAPEKALDDNERYRVVWQILNALRAHDDRFDATINKLELNKDAGDQIEVIAVSDNLPLQPTGESGPDIGGGSEPPTRTPEQINFIFDEFPAAIRAKIVEKCGRRAYWETWAKDVGEIAQKHIARITAILENDGEERREFDRFLKAIQRNLNGSVTEKDAIEMLAQHLVTKPVFDALFDDYDFAGHNPVSQAMQRVVESLESQNLRKESQNLEGFYASVKRRAAGIDNAEGKQKVILELYDKFFKRAFPKLAKKLGIVYTPVEVVDFIIHGINDILKQEFGQTLGSEGVHILDPFTGTGTFITRLLQSGLITPEELEYKFREEIHANEIVPLAYYIAAVNIEAAYHGLSGGDYKPFNGICLTDTFEMCESNDMIAKLMEDNSERRKRQMNLDIKVIIGNPPYSAKQKRESDNAKNVKYPALDASIGDSYAEHSKAKNLSNLYDSYIRAFRWASDRINDEDVNAGVIGFVTNSSWIDGKAMDGMRKCLADEFTDLYVFNLRGDIRKEISSKDKVEGGNVFGQGSQAGISIAFLVKNPDKRHKGRIHYHDIGMGLKTAEKLEKIKSLESVSGITEVDGWQNIEPNKCYDWINQRDVSFEKHILIGDKKDESGEIIFEDYSGGVKTQRDAWCCNYSKSALEANVGRLIETYNRELMRYNEAAKVANINDFIESDPAKIKWTVNLKNDLGRRKSLAISDGSFVVSTYRPFTKQWLFYSRRLNERVYQMPRVFPESGAANRTIAIGAQSGFSCLMCDHVPDLNLLESGANCYPFKLYEADGGRRTADGGRRTADGLFSDCIETDAGCIQRDGITDYGLKHFQSAYDNTAITKEDVFCYTYGLLHSEDYRTRFANNLIKQLPHIHIPAVNKEDDFWAFTAAGRELGDLHVNYETVDPYPVIFAEGDLGMARIDDSCAFYRVEKMKFGEKNKDKTIVHYNRNITITGIPLEAYDYVVNGNSALWWVMNRQCVSTDKASGIVNDANDYANETMNNPAYPLVLFQRVITVSLETQRIVNGLPELDID